MREPWVACFIDDIEALCDAAGVTTVAELEAALQALEPVAVQALITYLRTPKAFEAMLRPKATRMTPELPSP